MCTDISETAEGRKEHPFDEYFDTDLSTAPAPTSPE